MGTEPQLLLIDLAAEHDATDSMKVGEIIRMQFIANTSGSQA